MAVIRNSSLPVPYSGHTEAVDSVVTCTRGRQPCLPFPNQEGLLAKGIREDCLNTGLLRLA